ncbi:GNAT family N-acetyltransferase [Paenibacillus tuaregi]|uniref:GNAT family N-acetyltransferase n=1 Tax=Paenibacillus tuaregi TaxID=1816681 RepID=UPI000838E390|nr:GNAT family N-acetyltransferase [Paenibacillus tuaregi]
MEFKLLTQYTSEDQSLLGPCGYKSYHKYEVIRSGTAECMTIQIRRVPLPEPYVKEWPYDSDELEEYNRIATLGHSWGAYMDGRLAGAVIGEPQTWNNTLLISSFHVAEPYQHRGIGSGLMRTFLDAAGGSGFRAVVLETQNTNAPAIDFYRRCGFGIEGLDMSLYSNEDLGREVAICMRYKFPSTSGAIGLA